MKAKRAIGVIAVVMVLHLTTSWYVVHNSPAPISTFHYFDQQLLNYPQVLRGILQGSGSPIEDVLPNAMNSIEPWDIQQQNSVYKNAVPLYLIVSALPATIFGISLASLRMGSFMLFALAGVLLFDLLRLMKNSSAGLIGTLALFFTPMVWQSILIPAPFLGLVCGVLLCLWSLWRTSFFTRPLVSIISSLALCILPLWGETAGDAMPALLICFPMSIFFMVVSLWKQKGKSVLGILGFLLFLWLYFPYSWLQFQFLHYVIDEARIHSTSVNTIWNNAYIVLYNLSQSLLVPSLFCLFIFSCLFSRTQRWLQLWLLCGGIPLIVAATLSQKNYDYYISAIIPLIIISIGLNYERDWRRYIYAVLGGLTIVSWFFLRHIDSKVFQFTVPSILYQDQNVLNSNVSSSHMFQHWRKPIDSVQQKRNAIASWLLKGEGFEILQSIPQDSLVLVSDSPNSDVVQYSATIARSDLLFHRTSKGVIREITQELIGYFPNVYVMMSNGVENPCQLDREIILIDSIRKAEDVCLWEITGFE
jgi:4-amino-4-deoxy-L-arabinose transferase-like glycosyltransferase